MLKKATFFTLFISFSIYTYFVYTSGTHHKKGQIFYNESARNGKQLFQENNCNSCHQIFGLGGYLGPDLTNFMSKYQNAESIAKAFLKSGARQMPNFHLSDEEIEDLVSYMKYIDEACAYPLGDSAIHFMGSLKLDTFDGE